MNISKAIEAAYAANGGKTEPPSVGIDKAGEAITASLQAIKVEHGTVASTIYATVVALALEQVINGYGPTVINFAVARDAASILPAGETAFSYLQTLAGAGYLRQARSRKGWILWVPSALERTAPTKASKATAENPRQTFVAAMLAAMTEDTPTAAEPKRKPRIVGKSLADLGKA